LLGNVTQGVGIDGLLWTG